MGCASSNGCSTIACGHKKAFEMSISDEALQGENVDYPDVSSIFMRPSATECFRTMSLSATVELRCAAAIDEEMAREMDAEFKDVTRNPDSHPPPCPYRHPLTMCEPKLSHCGIAQSIRC